MYLYIVCPFVEVTELEEMNEATKELLTTMKLLKTELTGMCVCVYEYMLVWIYACMHMYVCKSILCVCVVGQPQCCIDTPFTPSLLIERRSCLEGKVFNLQHEHDLRKLAMQGIQSGQDSQNEAKDLQSVQVSLCQRMDGVEVKSRGRLRDN